MFIYGHTSLSSCMKSVSCFWSSWKSSFAITWGDFLRSFASWNAPKEKSQNSFFGGTSKLNSCISSQYREFMVWEKKSWSSGFIRNIGKYIPYLYRETRFFQYLFLYIFQNKKYIGMYRIVNKMFYQDRILYLLFDFFVFLFTLYKYIFYYIFHGITSPKE